MANEREEGLAALQNGDFQTAQTKLETAIALDPQDAQAHLYLGGVYHQLQRHSDAVRVLSQATELQPMSAQAHYNLGIALEALGSHAQALQAYNKAVALQSNYTLAQQGQERMQKAVQSAQTTTMYGTPPTAPVYGDPPAAPVYQPAPPPPGYQPPQPGQPYSLDQTQPTQPYAAPPPPPGQPAYGQPPGGYAPPQQYDLAGNPIGTPQPAYGQPPTPGGYAPGPAGYQGQQWSPHGAQALTKADGFDIGQAFKDWLQLIIAPVRFFDTEEGASGFSAPLALTLVYMLVLGVFGAIGTLISGNAAGLIRVLITIPLGFLIYTLIWLIWAGINHIISRLFGGNGEYSGSFRASVYAAAPFMTTMLAVTLLSPIMTPKSMQTGMAEPQAKIVRAQYGSNPYARPSFGRPSNGQPTFGQPAYGTPGAFGNARYGANPYAASGASPLLGVIVLVGMVWSMVLMVFGMRATQQLSTGAAVGTVMLSVILMMVIFFVLAMALGAAIAGLVMSQMH